VNYLFILSIEDDSTKSLLHEEAIKEYAVKNVWKNVLQMCVSQLSNEIVILFCCTL